MPYHYKSFQSLFSCNIHMYIYLHIDINARLTSALRLKELQKNSQLAQANEQMQQQQQPQDGPPQKQRRSMEDTRGGRAPISQHSREAPPRHQRSGGGVGFNGNHIENRPQQPPPPQQQIPPMPQQARPPPLPQAMAAPPLPSHAPPPS